MLLSLVLLIMVSSAFVGYSIAFRSAVRAYDRTLFDTALAIREQVHIVDGKQTLNLIDEAEEVLLTDNFDQIFFRVFDARGNEIGGNRSIPLPKEKLPKNKGYFYNAEIDGMPVRVAALSTEKAQMSLTILSAETQVKRDNLVREILIGMLFPELILLCAAPVLIWFGIRAGLRPLEDLRRQLASRSRGDLRPIGASEMAYEIQPFIRQLNHLLCQLDESRCVQDAFVSNAAHQLRTPIAALYAQFEAMLRESENPHRTQIAQVLPALRRLARLIHQLLALARVEPADEIKRQPTDLSSIVRDLADGMLSRAIAKGIDLGFDLEPAEIRGSDVLLREAISNLIDNAICYTPENGRITVSCRPDSGGAVLCVEDSGPGIPEEERKKVFDRFYRLPGSAGEGSGLGLAIVWQIARQHGALSVIGESSALKGASVSLLFGPLEKKAEDNA